MSLEGKLLTQASNNKNNENMYVTLGYIVNETSLLHIEGGETGLN